MASKFTYVSLDNLKQYDGLIKGYIGEQISDGVKSSLKSVSITGNTLKFYTEVKPTADTAPAFSVDLPETDLSDFMHLIKNATAGDVVVANADGSVADGGVKLADLAKSADVTKEIGDAKTELEGKIKANTDAIAAHKELVDAKVTTLIGNDADKSVRTIANEELAAQLIPAGAKESLNTLQEIAAWIQKHPDDASAMNAAITALQGLVGTIPEGATSSTIVAYIKELVDAEKTRATGVEGGLDKRIEAVEGLVGEGGSVDEKIATAKGEAEKYAKDYADGLAKNYATAEQGKKADTALQEADVTELRTDVAANKASLAEGGATANAIKANKEAAAKAQGDVNALATRVETLESVEYVAATEEEIKALFPTA